MVSFSLSKFKMGRRFSVKLLVFLVLSLVTSALLTSLLTGEKSFSQATPLIMVRVQGGDEIQSFHNAGLNLVEVDQDKGEIILTRGSDEHEFLQDNSYDYQVLVQDIQRTEPLNSEIRTYTSVYDRDDYRTWEEFVDELLAIEALYPDIARLHIVGYSHWGLPIYALEISDALGVRDGRPESFHESLMHATEWPSGEMAMELAWHLTGNYGSDEQVNGIVENIRTWIMPVVNPDGLIYHHVTGTFLRKNRRENTDGTFGVDINRNFSYGWSARGTPDTGHRHYRGPYAYSEPETQAYGDFLLSNDFITVLRGHTFLEVIYYADPIEEDKERVEGMLEKMAAWTNYAPRGTGPGGGAGNFIYDLTRGISICLEYQKRAITPYEGYPAPGLETDAFGMMKGNSVWCQIPIRDPHPVTEVEARLIDCGPGQVPQDFPSEVAGNIAFIKQGDGYRFDTQYELARDAGAAGVIIYNHSDGYTRVPTVRNVPITIPIMVLRGEDGSRIASHLDSGQTLTARMVPEAFMQDSIPEVWERTKKAILLNIEEAAEHAAVIEGTVSDRVSGEHLTARLDKQVDLKAPMGGPHTGQSMQHTHHTYIETDGLYTWHVLPSKQPHLDTPPYEIIVSAPGRYPQTIFLAVDNFGEEHSLDFALQPVAELQEPFLSQETWPVNSTVPFNFVTVDPMGCPVDMDSVAVTLYSDGVETATFGEGTDAGDIKKGDTAGEYLLSFHTHELGLFAGVYELAVEFNGPEGEQSFSSALVLEEQLSISGPDLLEIPEPGLPDLLENYAAYTYGPTGDTVPETDVSWSMEQAVAGVDVDSAGAVTVTDSAASGVFTLTAESGGLTGSIPVTLATSHLPAAIDQAETAISALPAAVTADEAIQVEEARLLVDHVVALGGTVAQVSNVAVLKAAERKLAGLADLMEVIEQAVSLAQGKIASLPDVISLEERDDVKEAGELVKIAVALGAFEEDISNIEKLRSAEADLEALIAGLVEAAETAIAHLPLEITLDDESAVVEARTLVEAALQADLDEKEISNLEMLLKAEKSLEKLFESSFVRESLFLQEEESHVGMDGFLDYYGRWRLDNTIGGVSFSPLYMYGQGLYMTTYGTPENPRQVEYNISGRGYVYVEGYLGVPDASGQTDHPLNFEIFVDGEPAFEVLLEYGREAIFYRLDIEGAEKIKFQYYAHTTSSAGYANRVGVVEPQFLIPVTEEILEAKEAAHGAIEELPETVSLLDEPEVTAARSLVEELFALGASRDFIENIDALESAEATLQEFYRDLFAKESLFVLGDPGEDNHVGMDRFIDYDGRWVTDRTIAGVSFSPLKKFATGLYMTTYGTPENPRWVEYDISGRDYSYVEGYAGVDDNSGQSEHPLDFVIFVDGEPVYEALLEYGLPAVSYRLDLKGAEKLKIQYSAKTTSAAGWANRPAFVEPMFLIPQVETAVTAAMEAIAALPAEITPFHEEEVTMARQFANNALALGAQPEEINNLTALEVAEGDLALMAEVMELVAVAAAAIDELPAEITLQDEPAVKAARELVDEALTLGAEQSYIENLPVLKTAEEALGQLFEDFFARESLFNLGHPGEDNHTGMVSFLDYSGWTLDDTINGVSFSPLKMFNQGESMATVGTPANPRRVEYDISGRGYAYVEGYLGVPDQSAETGYPLNTAILIDGEPVLEVMPEHGQPAFFYRLSLQEAEKIEFLYYADSISPDGYANCPGFIEPQFLIPRVEEAVSAASAAIDALPAEITPLVKEQVAAARRQVDNALALGAQTEEISNLGLLTSAEADLAEWAETEGTMSYAVALAEIAIDQLPAVITSADREQVFQTRFLVNDALRSGAIPIVVSNLQELEEAEEALKQLLEMRFQKYSLFTLNPVDFLDGPLNEMSTRFAEYGDQANWDYGRTVYNHVFDPLKVYNRGHRDLNQQPQWIEYDISDKGFDYVEGYVGIWDGTSSTSDPPTFRIYGEIDGKMELLFGVEQLWQGEPAYHYFIDLSGVDRLRFYQEAETVSANGWTNRIAIVEPVFYTALDLPGMIASAEAAIAALPDIAELTPDDEDAVLAARSLVNETLSMGAVESDISNLSVLVAAEEALAGDPDLVYGDIDGNGVINVDDVILVMQYVLGLIQLDETRQQAADVNGDGTINVDDVILIMQRVLGLIEKFPVES